jgi:hypothetical protein
MSDTALKTACEPSWFEWGSGDTDCSETKITENHTSEKMSKEALRQIDMLEYRKIALLNYRNDLMNKLADCANQIAETDYEIRAINLKLIERVKFNRRYG